MKSPEISVGTLLHIVAASAEIFTTLAFVIALSHAFNEHSQYAATVEQAFRLAFSDTIRSMAIPLIATLAVGPAIHITAFNSDS
jgi:hypothetical protein